MRGLTLLLPFLLLAAPGSAAAHRLAPSLLELREGRDGVVDVRWRTPVDQPAGARVSPELPEACVRVDEPTLTAAGSAAELRFRVRCGEQGLVGRRVGVRGLDTSGTAALVRVEFSDGRSQQALLDGTRSGLRVSERAGASEVALEYTRLGFRHILEGWDHLAFVLGLTLLVPSRRRLVGTVTAFTAGHSVTLSLAALGFLGLPPRLVELAIAASVLALAVELAIPPGRERGLRRRPWLLAGPFGLLHGLGFAGALSEVGLPSGEIPLALLCFNVGIELGQLLFVVAVWLGAHALGSWTGRAPRWLARVPAYGIGTLASFWCIERALLLF